MTWSPKENFQGSAVGGVGIEGGERGIAGGEGLVGPLVAGIGHVETGGGEDGLAEEGQGGDVHGELAERHGFFMTLEVGLVFGDAREDFAGHCHFDVVVLEEEFCGGHGYSPFDFCGAGFGCSRWRGDAENYMRWGQGKSESQSSQRSRENTEVSELGRRFREPAIGGQLSAVSGCGGWCFFVNEL
jgi:hypothetical protein